MILVRLFIYKISNRTSFYNFFIMHFGLNLILLYKSINLSLSDILMEGN